MTCVELGRRGVVPIALGLVRLLSPFGGVGLWLGGPLPEAGDHGPGPVRCPWRVADLTCCLVQVGERGTGQLRVEFWHRPRPQSPDRLRQIQVEAEPCVPEYDLGDQPVRLEEGSPRGRADRRVKPVPGRHVHAARADAGERLAHAEFGEQPTGGRQQVPVAATDKDGDVGERFPGQQQRQAVKICIAE
jgi:hypothetical protein